jgi:hypothetical protein
MKRRPILRRNEQRFLAARRSARLSRPEGMARARAHEIGDLLHGDSGEVLEVTAVFPGEVVLRQVVLDDRQRPVFGKYQGMPVRRMVEVT